MRAIAILAVALLLALAACDGAPLPMATAADDAAGKQMTPPSPGMVALYVYRVRNGNTATITAGQRTLGVLGGGNWLRAELPPGAYDVRCSLPAWPTLNSINVDLKPGEVLFVSAKEVLRSLWSADCGLAVEPEGVARPAILAGSRVKEIAP